MSEAGTVYLVGAGPGDPGLLTLKGAECLSKADVVVYDRLSNARLLEHAPGSAELVFMGKEPDASGDLQHTINNTLVERAKAGKTVVRLKGGDPFVFGRGGEEGQALKAAGVPFQVVPGITSAVAVPAYAGIPVTHRGLASAFTVVSGSEDPAKPEPSLDWAALAAVPGTLVVLMGWRSLPAIIGALLEHGRPAGTPVAVTQWGTQPQQRTVTGTLSDIVDRGHQAGLTSPVVTVIGEVAGLRETLQWFDNRPLFGKRVLVTRSRTQAGALSRQLAAWGAEPVELPTIEITPPDDYRPVDQALADISHYQWLVFLSANGVNAAFDRLRQAGKDARHLGPVRVAAVGAATAEALAQRGVVADLVPDAATSDGVVHRFSTEDLQGSRVLVLRADIGEEGLPMGLRALGARVDEVVAYRTVSTPEAAGRARELLTSGTIDVAVFTSSSTVRNLVALLGDQADALTKVLVATIGPVTSATARELGLRVDVEAPQHHISGLVAALVDHFANGTGEG